MARRPSLRYQLLLAFLIASLAGGGAFALVAWDNAVHITEREARRAVSIDASQREAALDRILAAARDRGTRLLDVTRSECGAGDRDCVRAQLGTFARVEGVEAVRLEPKGAAPIVVGDDRSLVLIARTLSPGQSGAIGREVGGTPFLLVVATRDGARLLVRGGLDRVVAAFVDEYGLGRNGEAFLADVEGRFVTSPKHEPPDGGHGPVRAAAMRRCLAGHDGTTIDRDYRGVETIMAFRSLHQIGGGCIMSHLDRSSALGAAGVVRNRLAGVAALFAALAGLASFALAHTLARPIERLTRRVRALSEGDFDSPVPVAGPAEVETLATAFAETAASLRVTQSRLVEERRVVAAALDSERHANRVAERAEKNLAFLAAAGSELTRSIHRDDVGAVFAHVFVPRLADWCVVWPAGGSPIVAGRDATVERVALRLAEAAAAAGVEPDGAAIEFSVEKHVPESWLERVDALDAGLGRIVREAEPGPVVTMPLRVGPTVVGLVALGTLGGRRYDAETIGLVVELASRGAVALQAATAYRTQRRTLQSFERSLLPAEMPSLPGIELAARYLPAGLDLVGGDFYDAFTLDDGSAMLVVGDVCGKDGVAAALSGFVRYTVRATAKHLRSPAHVVDALNHAIREKEPSRFCTICVARIRPPVAGEVEITLCRGGHPAPLVLRHDGVVEEAGTPGPAPGILSDAAYTEARIRIAHGDTLVFFTDGVTESRQGDEQFGDDRLRSVVARMAGQPADDVLDAVLTSVAEHGGAASRRDDIVLVGVRAWTTSLAVPTPAAEPLSGEARLLAP